MPCCPACLSSVLRPQVLLRRRAGRVYGALGGVLAGWFLISLPGCRQETVTSYRVPRTSQERLLGAIVPHADKVWFLKVRGPDEIIQQVAPQVEQFLASLEFVDQKEPPLRWQVPPGWRVGENKPGRLATFLVGPEKQPLELTVLGLPRQGQADSVLANVNRWRGQLGLPPVEEDELKALTQTVRLRNGETATLVNLLGPSVEQLARWQQPVEERPVKSPVSRSVRRLSYQTPAGWQEMPAEGFRIAAFRVVEGNQHAEITVIPLPGTAGGLLDNVNRWRQQLGLPPLANPEALEKEIRYLEVAGVKSPYVDLTGPEKAGGQQRTLAVAVPRPQQTWFFKMTGDADLVGRQKAAFESFVASVHFLDNKE